MRKMRRHEASEVLLLVGEDARYCALCECVMLFEEVDADDDEPGEWVCVTCGSAVFVDPPVQSGVRRTA